MGMLRDLLQTDKETESWGWLAPYRETPRVTIGPEKVSMPVVDEPRFDALPPVQNFLPEEIETEEGPDEAPRPAPESSPVVNPSAKQSDEIEVQSNLIQEVKAHGYRIKIVQEGRTYKGTVKFCSGPRTRDISLVSDSLGHLRISLQTFGRQGVQAKDVQADDPDFVEPSNQNPSAHVNWRG